MVSPYCLGDLAIAAGEKTAAAVAEEIATKKAVGKKSPYFPLKHPLHILCTQNNARQVIGTTHMWTLQPWFLILVLTHVV